MDRGCGIPSLRSHPGIREAREARGRERPEGQPGRKPEVPSSPAVVVSREGVPAGRDFDKFRPRLEPRCLWRRAGLSEGPRMRGWLADGAAVNASPIKTILKR